MLNTYFKLTLRHLSNNRLYSVINILGLAVGIAACLLIFRLVHYELSFNTFFKNYERAVRIVTTSKSEAEGEGHTPGIPIPAMDVMQNTVTQFEQFARIRETWPIITVPDAAGGASSRKFNMLRVTFKSSNFDMAARLFIRLILTQDFINNGF